MLKYDEGKSNDHTEGGTNILSSIMKLQFEKKKCSVNIFLKFCIGIHVFLFPRYVFHLFISSEIESPKSLVGAKKP